MKIAIFAYWCPLVIDRVKTEKCPVFTHVMAYQITQNLQTNILIINITPQFLLVIPIDTTSVIKPINKLILPCLLYSFPFILMDINIKIVLVMCYGCLLICEVQTLKRILCSCDLAHPNKDCPT